ncbi:MAG: serine/threonine-protein kinase [Kofleriaceae bacterium]
MAPENPDSTIDYPDQIETVDVLGAKARAERAAAVTGPETALPEPPPIQIGRYRLLEMVGAGGMGMVWGAWDPELERRVALKLVRYTSAGSRERMLREGQVLAKLSHPNVVPIFDVGVMGDQVYLVMEWIRGVTLRAFGASKPGTPALLEAYRQAGVGLAAAHRAGVVHRDFKPDNAIRGDDGRVRVLDFGLAHEAGSTVDTAVAGTPRYMPPEQQRGEVATEASDQYAFAVSLREAIGEVPGWIEDIVERATRDFVDERYDSMDEVVAELARDPARRWRRAGIGGVALVAAIAAFAVGRAGIDSAEAIEPCSGAGAELATSWNSVIRDRVIAHVRTLGPASADAERVGRDLDGYASRWIEQHRNACIANERTDAPAVYERQLRCLGRTRAQLAATGELLSSVDAAGLAPALLAAHSLPGVAGCADPGVVEPPPAGVADRVKAAVPRVERALVRAIAQKTDSVAEAKAAAREARAIGYEPLIARALLVEGVATSLDETDPRELFAESMRRALRASDDATAVEAHARWIHALAIRGEQVDANWPVMVELADRQGRSGRLGRALMYNNRGLARMIAGDHAGARTLFETAARAAGDSDEIELLTIPRNLALLETDPAAARRRLGILYDTLRGKLGESNPETYQTRQALGMLEHDRVLARVDLEAACLGLERWQQTLRFADCAYEAAWLADDSGDTKAAVDWMKRIVDPSPEVQQISAAYIALTNAGADRVQHLATLAKLATTLDRTSRFQRRYATDTLVLLARTEPRLWEKILPIVEGDMPVLYSRRVARARSTVAELWAKSRPADAARLATAALAWYRGVPADEAIVKRLEALATARTR